MVLKCGIVVFLLFIIIKCDLVSSDEVPVILWNIKGNSLHVKPVSAMERSDKVFSESFGDVLSEESKIVVFAVNKLSLEDFSANDKLAISNSTLHSLETFLDSQSHMLLPSVKDPLNKIHKAHCGVQEIIVDKAVDSTVLQSIDFEKACVVILHISDEGFITKKGGNLEEIKKSFLPSLENAKSIVGIFTSMKSSLGLVVNDHHIFRNLLAVDSANPNFINFDGCIIMYMENGTLRMGKEDNNTITLPVPPTTDGSVCSNDSQILQLNFETSGSITSVKLIFSFTKKAGSWKANTTVTMTGDKAPTGVVILASDKIEAPVGFSYSCGNTVFEATNVTEPFSITLSGFQVQPYEIMNSVFSDSFDCVSFFTIPIWMGIFISILFIVIMNVGIYALFSVHTMDRFDDPKGKTISVAAATD